MKLINQIRNKLKLYSPFLFAFDNASLYSSNNVDESELLSHDGSKCNILSIIRTEILELRKINSSTICDIYASSRSSNANSLFYTPELIHLSGHGRRDDITRKLCNFHVLDLISITKAKEMTEMIYNTNELQNLFDEEDEKIIFPTRRIVIGMLCERLKGSSNPCFEYEHGLSNFPFESTRISPLKRCWIEIVQIIVKNTKESIEENSIPLDVIKEMYMRGVYPQFFSKYIHIKASALVEDLIGTGLATPTTAFDDEAYFFDCCSDPITKQVCKEIISHYHPELVQDNISPQPLTMLKLLLARTNNPSINVKEGKSWGWDKMFALLLRNCDQKSTDEIPFLKSFKPITQLKVNHCMDAIDFYYCYHETDWAKSAIHQFYDFHITTKIVIPPTSESNSNEKFSQLGDLFYWYCVSQVDSTTDEKECNQFRKIVDGLVYFPSKNCHPNSILINIQENPKKHLLYLTSNKIHNDDDNGELSCVDYELFYSTSTNKKMKKNKGLQNPYSKWWTDYKTKQLGSFFANSLICKIIAPIHIGPKTEHNLNKVVMNGTESIKAHTTRVNLHQLEQVLPQDLFLQLEKYFENVNSDALKKQKIIQRVRELFKVKKNQK